MTPNFRKEVEQEFEDLHIDLEEDNDMAELCDLMVIGMKQAYEAGAMYERQQQERGPNG